MNGTIKILIADDEPSITQFLELGLTNEGYETFIANNGPAALEAAKQFKPHIVILDIMMPGMDGFAICNALRSQDSQIAIIMLTAKDEIEDRVKGLNIGADDYMVKPFSFTELLARIGARIRNQFPHLLDVVEIGPFRMDGKRNEIAYNNQLLELSPTEYKLLQYLVLNKGVVLSKSSILDHVWGYQFGGDYNIVEVYIRSLRDKLQDADHRLIRTLRGAGYRLDL
ncbi:response regulator transcription factor [Paenibacillus sp. GXUN7292]|uniref:response regulator transcription factor n=1 Tax=Paenibacillus sp. GXUN7292 TaxID=3422499 RepID=UPI003D7CDF32